MLSSLAGYDEFFASWNCFLDLSFRAHLDLHLNGAVMALCLYRGFLLYHQRNPESIHRAHGIEGVFVARNSNNKFSRERLERIRGYQHFISRPRLDKVDGAPLLKLSQYLSDFFSFNCIGKDFSYFLGSWCFPRIYEMSQNG